MEQPNKQSIFSKPWVQSTTGIIIIALVLIGALVWKSLSSHVSIDKSQISAPMINIGPETAGILAEVYVQPGDTVTAGQPVARVGSETLSAQVAGLVITTHNTPGQVFASGVPVVTMIDPTQLRVVGTIEEDKGLSDLKVGQPVSFTVDAYGSAEFTGLIDEISPTSNDSGVAFTISDQRETKNFTVKVRYDTAAHPEFKNGMSAKMTVYIK
ncbi:MAG: multidrug resistance efflux pump [Candidatus Nomurabacteria bacterium]|nr:multidrug resistance efflux pump [Candidatus Nomurabacteria bacterium]